MSLSSIRSIRSYADVGTIMNPGGMMFVFIDDNEDVSAYVSYDVMFDHVIGFQYDMSFITNDMYLRMQSQLNLKEGEDFYHSRIPTDPDEMADFLYEYSSIMDNVRENEISRGTFVMRLPN